MKKRIRWVKPRKKGKVKKRGGQVRADQNAMAGADRTPEKNGGPNFLCDLDYCRNCPGGGGMGEGGHAP